ncbi:hypothetical protein [Bradyrhizobium valentinum]|uniref:hypothetical protein n=1 Tax=Bradyrhizobium valentinum TaxID=1518501 RepID=UPI0012E39FCE|nr:hypothetical protein [Bradyrhizobium valentinum]
MNRSNPRLLEQWADISARRFARSHAKRGVRMRRALRRVNGYLKAMIEAIADSKVRRMRHDLELRGIRFDPPGNNWVVRHSASMERPSIGHAVGRAG